MGHIACNCSFSINNFGFSTETCHTQTLRFVDIFQGQKAKDKQNVVYVSCFLIQFNACVKGPIMIHVIETGHWDFLNKDKK